MIVLYMWHILFSVKGCSNPQKVYVTKEGQPVQICFTFYNNIRIRISGQEIVQVVNFVTESTSTLGKSVGCNEAYL